jgi:hypothetical protein
MLLNDVKFPIDGCNDPVLEEISLIKKGDCHGK